MRRLLIPTIMLLFAQYAAATSTSNFTVDGTITGSTCKITNPNVTVTIPVRSRTALANVGDTAGSTPFSITAENCPPGTVIYFQNDQKNISAQGRLLNTAVVAGGNSAKNVELEILNSTGTPVNLSANKGLQNNSSATAVSGGVAYDFYVRYYATGVATAGNVKSSLTFLVESF